MQFSQNGRSPSINNTPESKLEKTKRRKEKIGLSFPSVSPLLPVSFGASCDTGGKPCLPLVFLSSDLINKFFTSNFKFPSLYLIVLTYGRAKKKNPVLSATIGAFSVSGSQIHRRHPMNLSRQYCACQFSQAWSKSGALPPTPRPTHRPLPSPIWGVGKCNIRCRMFEGRGTRGVGGRGDRRKAAGDEGVARWHQAQQRQDMSVSIRRH